MDLLAVIQVFVTVQCVQHMDTCSILTPHNLVSYTSRLASSVCSKLHI